MPGPHATRRVYDRVRNPRGGPPTSRRISRTARRHARDEYAQNGDQNSSSSTAGSPSSPPPWFLSMRASCSLTLPCSASSPPPPIADNKSSLASPPRPPSIPCRSSGFRSARPLITSCIFSCMPLSPPMSLRAFCASSMLFSITSGLSSTCARE